MFILNVLQSLVFLGIVIVLAFFCARVITNAELRHTAQATAERRVSLAYLMAEPEPAKAPSAHLRLVWSQPALPEDVPYDQMKELAR